MRGRHRVAASSCRPLAVPILDFAAVSFVVVDMMVAGPSRPSSRSPPSSSSRFRRYGLPRGLRGCSHFGGRFIAVVAGGCCSCRRVALALTFAAAIVASRSSWTWLLQGRRSRRCSDFIVAAQPSWTLYSRRCRCLHRRRCITVEYHLCCWGHIAAALFLPCSILCRWGVPGPRAGGWGRT